MIAVIFEAIPHPEHSNDYFDIAAALKDHLEEVDGFLSVERFESLTHPGKFLSLSFWRDEEAVQQWRNLQVHRSAQGTGRNRVFADYRLRVAAVVRDYGLEDRKEAPDDSLSAHRPE